MSHRAKQHIECDAGRGQGSSSGAGTKMQEQVANGLFYVEIGDTELFTSVEPKGVGLTENGRPV